MALRTVTALLLVASVALVASGCIYANIRTPRAYRSATPGDIKAAPADRLVSGEACYQTVLYAVSWGDASYATAAERALAGEAGAILYDVKADTRVTSILLGLYTKICTILTARVTRP